MRTNVFNSYFERLKSDSVMEIYILYADVGIYVLLTS